MLVPPSIGFSRTRASGALKTSCVCEPALQRRRKRVRSLQQGLRRSEDKDKSHLEAGNIASGEGIAARASSPLPRLRNAVRRAQLLSDLALNP